MTPQQDKEALVLDKLRSRRAAYRNTFALDPCDQEVLQDLAQFCRAHVTCFHPNQRISDMLEGRREVWLRIANHLNLSTEQLFSIFNARTFKKENLDG